MERVSVRGWDLPLADTTDIEERGKTLHLMRDGFVRLFLSALLTLFQSPKRFFGAGRLALKQASRSDRTYLHHLAYLAQACRLLQYTRERDISHIHAHFGTNPAEIAMLTRALGGPSYSFTVHGADEADRGQRLGLDEKVARAKFVVAISSYTRSQLLRLCDPAHWAKVKVVHTGLDNTFLDDGNYRAPGGRLFLCVGRLSPEKGQLILIEAFKKLVDRGNSARLVLAGDGPMRAQLEAVIRNAGLEGHVTITGWLSSHEIKDLILDARALVLPSFQEGLPVVLMEAMSLGRPVIASNVCGIPELVCDTQNGWLIPPGSPQALAATMEACLAVSSADLAAMGERGRHRVLTRHNASDEATKILALIDAASPPEVLEDWQTSQKFTSAEDRFKTVDSAA